MKAIIKIEGDMDTLKVLSGVFVDEGEERRSRAKIYLTPESFVVEIEADDLTALRASVSSHLRLLRACVETLEVMKDG